MLVPHPMQMEAAQTVLFALHTFPGQHATPTTVPHGASSGAVSPVASTPSPPASMLLCSHTPAAQWPDAQWGPTSARTVTTSVPLPPATIV